MNLCESNQTVIIEMKSINGQLDIKDSMSSAMSKSNLKYQLFIHVKYQQLTHLSRINFPLLDFICPIYIYVFFKAITFISKINFENIFN